MFVTQLNYHIVAEAMHSLFYLIILAFDMSPVKPVLLIYCLYYFFVLFSFIRYWLFVPPHLVKYVISAFNFV